MLNGQFLVEQVSVVGSGIEKEHSRPVVGMADTVMKEMGGKSGEKGTCVYIYIYVHERIPVCVCVHTCVSTSVFD